MTSAAKHDKAGSDLGVLDAITDAVESGSGLPDVVRAAAKALDASLVLVDRAGAVLAVAARSPADERSLAADGAGVESIELRVADEPVGTLRMRLRGSQTSGSAMVKLVTTLVASEVERVRAPERASREAAAAFVHALLDRSLVEPEAILAQAAEIGLDLESGASLLVARAHPQVTVEDGWRARVIAVVERGARAVNTTAIAVPAGPERVERGAAEVVVVLPGGEEEQAGRAAEGVLRELQAGLQGHTFAVGRSRVATDVADLARAGNEALLAANVAEGDEGERPLLAFDATGAYRLLLPAMMEDPAELQRFYAETVESLVSYDEQYETDLVQTVVAFLEADGNVAGTAQRLFTHRHTIRYRLERVRDLSGLDVGSTDGREKLSLGLKAMRVLGIAKRGGPATERGAGGGRVPRR
ncbi:MAG: helix-turn-helix domain-containing protein [Solirubrobacterales bacterium]|nr:helix-turn-helix domain-containing protein [Solirubrobacterales bacterium]